MNPTPHEETLFQAALPLAGAERAAFLDRECAGDPALRARLEALLAAHDQPDTLLGTQAGATRPTISLDLARDLADDLVGQTIGRYKLLDASVALPTRMEASVLETPQPPQEAERHPRMGEAFRIGPLPGSAGDFALPRIEVEASPDGRGCLF
ncbi:MAG: hypothetical protein M5U12_11970 [Verrucomicrobia bacterium]|nr:hypothetical protein [Verrucomicrobiota bacterium]